MFDPVFALILFTSIMLAWALAEATFAVFGASIRRFKLFTFNRRNGAPKSEDRITS